MVGLKDALEILGPGWQDIAKVALGAIGSHFVAKCFKKGIKDIVRSEVSEFKGIREDLAKNTAALANVLAEFETYTKRLNTVEVFLAPLMTGSKKKVNGGYRVAGD